MQIDPYLTLFIQLNSKRIQDLNIRTDILTLTEENVGGGDRLELVDTGKDFMNSTPRAKSLRPKL
ncbi:hypothetical protein I79_013035 [Cricetulus griseus]|uniref:Uncharacterized protein n=1 Tax=Cricetulus griseus TaxID=10029 RepID=G3HQD8_CRIGR|nr:hypothetical protein I79_013035 [Cricetulus griseus]